MYRTTFLLSLCCLLMFAIGVGAQQSIFDGGSGAADVFETDAPSIAEDVSGSSGSHSGDAAIGLDRGAADDIFADSSSSDFGDDTAQFSNSSSDAASSSGSFSSAENGIFETNTSSSTDFGDASVSGEGFDLPQLQGNTASSFRRRGPNQASRRRVTVKESQDVKKLRGLERSIEEEKNAEKRVELAAELRKHMQMMFDADYQKREEELTKLEDRVARLREVQDRRKAARDRIIEVRIEKLMLDVEGLSFPMEREQAAQPGRSFNFRSASQQFRPGVTILKQTVSDWDGFTDVEVLHTTQERRQSVREVPNVKTVQQQRVRTVGDRQQNYTVTVPTREMRQETYETVVPKQTVSHLRVPPGVDVTEYVEEQLSKEARPAVAY